MNRKRILIVDDSRTALMMTTTLLKSGPYDIVTGMNGEEAVAKAAALLPDLIVLDIVMPKMNGIEACRQIRAGEATQAIPIILVTTRGEPDNIEKGFECGCTDYVTKPINATELQAKVRNCLGM